MLDYEPGHWKIFWKHMPRSLIVQLIDVRGMPYRHAYPDVEKLGIYASICGFHPDDSKGVAVAMANAYIISAAPDMLSTLKIVRDRCESLPSDVKMLIDAVIKNATAGL